jgi:hypothetical protein
MALSSALVFKNVCNPSAKVVLWVELGVSATTTTVVHGPGLAEKDHKHMIRTAIAIKTHLICLLLATSARATIIIDDFDDPAQAVSPAMDNVYVNTTGVGDLNAFRAMRLATLGSDADARIDIAGSMRVEMNDLHPTGVGRSVVAAQCFYTFSSADLSSGNAFMLDFNSVMGPTPPEFMRVVIFDDDQRYSYYDTFTPIPAGDGFTAVLPFADFMRRDGVPWPINFHSIREVDLEIYGLGLFGGPLDQGWTIEVDSFRIATVPEPSGAMLFLFTFTLFWRRHAHHPNSSIDLYALLCA